jgi:polar amino acid transport system substrate-binding protein
LGQLTAQILLANGCSVLGTDLNADHVARAERAGVKGIRPGTDVKEACFAATRDYGVDGVIVCAATASSEPVALAGEVSRERGRVVLTGAVGMDVPRDPYFRKEVSLIVSRSYGPGRYDPSYEEGGYDYPFGYVRFTEQRNMEAFLGLVAAGKVDVSGLITHRYDFADALEAYGLIDGSRAEPFLGIVLKYAGAERTAEPARIDVRPAPVDPGKVAVSAIGAGNYATAVLLPALAKTGAVQFRGIATAGGRSAATAAQRFGFAYTASDVAEVLDDDASVVAILTRHDSHADLAARALEAGKHVFVEKPLALDVDGLTAVRASALAGRGQLLVGFNRRFAPLTARVREHFAGVTGPKTVTIRANAGVIPLDHWTQDPERGGGRLIGEACHFVDLAQALVGSDVVAVQGVGAGNGKSPLLNDDFVLTLAMKDGSTAAITYTASGAPAMDKEYVEVFGGGLAAVIEDFRSGTLYGPGGASTKIGGRTQDKGQAAMLTAFIAALRSGTPCVAPDSLLLTTLATFKAVEAIGAGRVLAVDLGELS